MENRIIVFKYLFLFLGLFIFHSAKSQNEFTKRNIAPNVTDSNISDWLSPHYLVHNKNILKEPELIIFFTGTGGKNGDISFFIDSIAKNATHTIGLTYPNTLTPWTYCQDKNEKCFELFRREVLWGSNDTVSIVQNINKSNSVINRITKLLEYLSINYKSEGWSDFLDNGNIVWSKIILGGFSQGGGLALFISKYYDVKRDILFSSPSDFFINTQKPASWLSKKGVTESNKIYSFSSQADATVPFYIQSAIWKTIGMSGNIEIINSKMRLTNQHQLTLVDGGHETPLTDKNNAPIWKYLFNTSPPSESIGINQINTVSIKQTNTYILFEFEDQDSRNKISLYNANGIEMYSKYSNESQVSINTQNISNGLLLVSIQTKNGFFSQKIRINHY